eukprot:scaffold4387_cov81-Cylindrotheca_fusiformis.AAC.1
MTPTLDFLPDSKLGCVVDGCNGLVRKLKLRFDSSPLNRLCYYQSHCSSEDAMVKIHGQQLLPKWMSFVYDSTSYSVVVADIESEYAASCNERRMSCGSTSLEGGTHLMDTYILNRMPNVSKSTPNA